MREENKILCQEIRELREKLELVLSQLAKKEVKKTATTATTHQAKTSQHMRKKVCVRKQDVNQEDKKDIRVIILQ